MIRAAIWTALAGIAAAAACGTASAACTGLSTGSISAKFSEAASACGDAARDPPLRTIAIPVSDLPASVGVRYDAPRVWRRAATRGTAPRVDAIAQVSRRYRIDPLLLDAIVSRESGYRPGAISHKGALGLMQVMPGTARGLGIADPDQMIADPLLGLSAGASYLKRLQGRFGNDVPTVLAAYNAGPGAVQRYGGAVPYAETRGYVSTIMTRYRRARQPRR